MRLDILFLAPDRPRPAALPAVHLIPSLAMCRDGAFIPNTAAHQMLNLRAGVRVLLGSSQQDPREWYLSLSATEGFPLLREASKTEARFRFKSAALRRSILATLPHAPQDKPLRFVLGEMPATGPDEEPIWPLLTAPYFQPQPEPTPEQEKLRKAAQLADQLGRGQPLHGLGRVLKTIQM